MAEGSSIRGEDVEAIYQCAAATHQERQDQRYAGACGGVAKERRVAMPIFECKFVKRDGIAFAVEKVDGFGQYREMGALRCCRFDPTRCFLKRLLESVKSLIPESNGGDRFLVHGTPNAGWKCGGGPSSEEGRARKHFL